MNPPPTILLKHIPPPYSNTGPEPIRVVKNNYKKQKKVHFFEEPGPLDNQEHFKYLYEDRVGKSILRATKPGIKEGGYDTRFTSCCFEEKKHKKYLLDNLKVGRDIPADIYINS